MKKQKSVYILLSFIFLIVNCSVVSAFQIATAPDKIKVSTDSADENGKIKEEQFAKLIQQLELLSRDTQSFNLFPNRVYFSVLTALDLYAAAQLLDKNNAENATNRKSAADSYKTYLYQVVNQQKAALDGAIDAAVSEQNKFALQSKNADAENGNNPEVVVAENSKSIFDLAGIKTNPSEDQKSAEVNNKVYLLVYLKGYTAYAIGEVDPELAFDFYQNDPIDSIEPSTQQYITSDLAEKRGSFVNKLFETEPEKAITKLTSLQKKPINFLTSEALASFYKKDPKKAAQFAQKILDESFAGTDSEDENTLYQKMSTYLYFLSYLKDSKLLSRNNPLITKSQALKIVDLLVKFYTTQESEESGGSEFIYVAEIIGDYSPEKANSLLQNSDYQIKPKKKKPTGTEPFTYDAPPPESKGSGESEGGIMTDEKPAPPAPPAKTDNKPAPEIVNQYFTQALQISNYNVSDVEYVNNLIKISKVFNQWDEFEKAQRILSMAQNIVSKAPTTSSDYILRFNLAQAYINSKNTPEAVKITENTLGLFDYFIQALITTSRYNRDNSDTFSDDGYELDSSLNSYYAYYLQSLVSSNSELFNAMMNENPEIAVNLGNKFSRKESQFVFRYYILDGYLKYLQELNKKKN